MNMEERNEEIWKMRCEGATLSRIAKEFGISSHRVRQICDKKKRRLENIAKWPHLKRVLPARIQNVLNKYLRNEDIYDHPERLAILGEKVFFSWKDMGSKSVRQLINALESLGYPVNRDVRMTDMKSESYFEIGRTILQKYFDYYTENSLDDTEYIPVVRLIIEGISEEMRSAGMPGSSCDEVAKKLKEFNRILYQNLWIEQAREDADEDSLDPQKECESARYTFDYIYEHGEHPE